MTTAVRLAWRIVLVAFAAEMVILAIAQVWMLLAFAVVWGAGFGFAAYRIRARFAKAANAAGLSGYVGFAAVVLVVAVAEESLCAAFGCQLAIANLWLDLIFVPVLWLAWLTGWYYLIAPRFKFDPDEALLVAASAGVLFELVGNGRIFADPFIGLLSVPGVILVYAAICVLPMSLIPWKGERAGRAKYPIAFFLPYLAALPSAIAFFIIASVLGIHL